MIVYVKNHKYGGNYNGFITPTQASAYYGFQDLGYDVEVVETVEDIPIIKDNIYISGLNETLKWFKQFNIYPPLIDYPNELHSFLKRKIIKTTIGELESYITGKKYFLKPFIEKQFEVSTIENYNDLSKFKNIDPSAEIWLSDFKQFDAEYRCYITQSKILGCYKYRGNSVKTPNLAYIQEMVNQYNTAPISYSIDVGLINGDIYLVEINDGFALSNYGLENYKYALMILNRWEELIKE